jgi:hypothetical protein
MTTPVPPGPPGGSGSGSSEGPPKLPPNFSGAAVSSNDPWYAYAQQMFPNTMVTPEEIAGLKKNMNSMINNTIAEINARQAEAQKYNEQVAKGEE